MRVTQQDIARLAGVSQATVSRVLAGDERVEGILRDRVLQVMTQHNYRPDMRARSLRKRKAGLIGLVIQRPEGELQDDPFFSSLIGGIAELLVDTSYHLCVDLARTSTTENAVYDDLLRTRRVDGLILVEPQASDERIAKLQAEGFPFVIIGNPMGSAVNSVDNDNVLAGRMATLHLIENGFGDIGFLGGPPGVMVSDDRLMGYSLAMRQHGIAERAWHSAFGYRAAISEARSILLRDDRPDGLVVMDDFMAMGVVQVCQELGLRIGDDVALASFNDSSLCPLVPGGLTSVNLNIPRLVRAACQKLIDLIEASEQPEPTRVLIPSELNVRGSSLRGDHRNGVGSKGVTIQ